MAYLNEDGLETLVGKIKGQVIELTSAEYRQLPATKNTDNKLYFVTDEAYAYQIDDEPTADSTGLVKSGGVYNWTSKIGSGTLTTTAQTLIPAVNELNAKIGCLKIVKYEGTYTIASTGDVIIDISSAIPSGKRLIAVLGAQVGFYTLPYMAQASTSSFLYIEYANTTNKTVKLKNTGTGDWNNYTVTITCVVG